MVLNSIGGKGEDIYQSINSFDISQVNGNPHQVWNYKDEKYINGGVYFNNVTASSPQNETFLRIDSIKNRTAPQTEASEKKIAELEAYKAEVIAAGSSGVITEPGTVFVLCPVLIS